MRYIVQGKRMQCSEQDLSITAPKPSIMKRLIITAILWAFITQADAQVTFYANGYAALDDSCCSKKRITPCASAGLTQP